MKKTILFVLTLLAISSCSVDEEMQVETTSVEVSTRNEFIITARDKNVQQGNIYGWINELQVVATNLASGIVSTTNFNLVPNGTPGAASKFIIDNVIIGKNTFTALSKTNVIEKLETAQVSKSVSFSKAINDLNSRNPYALYTSAVPVTIDIIQGNSQNVVIPMKTDNSRLIALFSTKKNHSAIITCFVDGARFGPSTTCTKYVNATFYWSDRNSLAGKSVYFRIKVDKPGSELIFTTPKITMKASNTTKMMYSIDNSLTIIPM